MQGISAGDTAFVLMCTALVCMMTPALALFYGGLVKQRDMLSVMMQNFICIGVVGLIWVFGGFSLAFGADIRGIIGDVRMYFGMYHVGIEPDAAYAANVPFILVFAYQMMFAIITPALMTGAFVGRFQFGAYLFFVAFWTVLVHWLKVDDTLEVWRAHGVGGMTGALMIGVVGSSHINKVEASLHQLGVQASGVVLVAAYACIVTVIILKLLDLTGKMRVSDQVQIEGLDSPMYGEAAYHLWNMDRKMRGRWPFDTSTWRIARHATPSGAGVQRNGNASRYGRSDPAAARLGVAKIAPA